jgi:hypothetical protein
MIFYVSNEQEQWEFLSSFSTNSTRVHVREKFTVMLRPDAHVHGPRCKPKRFSPIRSSKSPDTTVLKKIIVAEFAQRTTRSAPPSQLAATGRGKGCPRTGIASAGTSRRMGHPDAHTCSRFPRHFARPCGARAARPRATSSRR